jgi:hypothetical protein
MFANLINQVQRNVEFYQALTKKDLALVGDVWLKSSTVQVTFTFTTDRDETIDYHFCQYSSFFLVASR